MRRRRESRLRTQTKKSSSRSATTEAAVRTPLAARDSVDSPTGSKHSVAGSSSRVLPGAERSCERRFRSAEQPTLAGHHLLEFLAHIAARQEVWAATPKPRASLISGRPPGCERHSYPETLRRSRK